MPGKKFFAANPRKILSNQKTSGTIGSGKALKERVPYGNHSERAGSGGSCLWRIYGKTIPELSAKRQMAGKDKNAGLQEISVSV